MKNNLRGLGVALASLERRIAAERIRAAIENARQHGKTCGQPDLLKSYQVEFALELVGKGQTVPSIAQRLHCGPATLYQAIAAIPTRRYSS
jgi:DNA invertase Pin-like site-specific DNA recombinase